MVFWIQLLKTSKIVNMKKMILNLFMTTTSKEDESQNCWEFLKCSKEIRDKCMIYKRKLGGTCWFIIEDIRRECYCYNKYDGCFNCPWYKKNNPDWETS